MNDLESKLKVGAKIKLGRLYCKTMGIDEDAGKIIELVKGYFDYDNGLYSETQTAPSVWNESEKDYDSIYHLFENDLSLFLDCEIIKI